MPQTKILQIVDNLVKQADNADTLDGKHASEFASASDVETLKTQVGDTSVSEQIDTALKGNQADWNQNDETAADYVKNRTHYVKSMTKSTIVDKTFEFAQFQDTIYASAELGFTEIFKDEQEYIVTFDGTEYNCIAHTIDDLTCFIGNGDLAGIEGGNNEPFIIVTAMDSTDYFAIQLLIGTLSTDSSHVVKIEHVIPDVKQLDKKYVPELEYLSKMNPACYGSFSLNRKANTTIGAYSFTEGKYTTASSECSHAEGIATTASGNASHAEGINTTASGNYSHAEGYNTTASGLDSHAEGSATKASADDSHAEGYRTTASGSYSHAEGIDTTAAGVSSHSEGSNTTASSDYQHVQGKYNIEDSNNIYADIIGNGNYDGKFNYSNAATVDWSGNAWYAGDVYVGSTSGTNKDEGSKKLATEDYVSTQISAIPTPDVSGQISTHNSDSSAHSDIRTSVSNLNSLVGDTAVSTQINNHNTSDAAHNDIRDLIAGLSTRLNALADSDDTTLDQLSEIVAYIKSNRTLIAEVTTNKVNVSDIIDNLTTNISNKPLSAAQGVAIKSLIDSLQTAVNGKATSDHTHSQYVSFTKHEGVNVRGTTQDTYSYNPGQLVVKDGIVIGGTAASAGLVTRGVCGVTSPDTTTGSCDKENLYLNYDGDNTYRTNRQVVLQAGTIGTHYGNNLYEFAVPRGEIVKNYCDANYGKKSSLDALSNLVGDTAVSTQITNAIANKVDKVDGKGLSTNDYTTDEKTKLSGIDAGANKTIVDSELDTESTNPVENQAITNWLADNVKNYRIAFSINGTNSYAYLTSEAVSTLAAAPNEDPIYALEDYPLGVLWKNISGAPTSMKNPNKLTVGSKTYDGSSAVTITASDLSAATETYVDNKFTNLVGDAAVSTQISTAINGIDYPVDSVNGKTGTVNLTAEDIGALPSSTQIPSIDGLATETYVDTKVAGIVDSAPEALNTLKELADALGNDNNFATTVATEIGKKVDKIEGKGLSTNDYTTAEKTKLSGIEEGANKTVIDSALSSTSTNPVQNKVVNTAISNLNTLVGDTSVAEQINTAVSNKAQVQILTWEATD